MTARLPAANRAVVPLSDGRLGNRERAGVTRPGVEVAAGGNNGRMAELDCTEGRVHRGPKHARHAHAEASAAIPAPRSPRAGPPYG